MQVNPYLFFDGNCREAFTFYAQCLHAEVKAMMPVADMPADATAEDAQNGCAAQPGSGDKIMHACLELDGSLLMASDWMSPEPFQPPRGIHIALGVASVDEAERVFEALSAGGQVCVPLAEAFFSDAFGILVDQYGVSWMVNCEKRT